VINRVNDGEGWALPAYGGLVAEQIL
jgi:hypothetical protein